MRNEYMEVNVKNDIIAKINLDIMNYKTSYELRNYFHQNREKSLTHKLLANICSYQINYWAISLPESLNKDYSSKELDNEDIVLLDNILNLLEHKELKAKIYHLLFLKRKKKNIQDLTQAMDLYFIENLDHKDIHSSLEKLSMILLLGNLAHKTTQNSYVKTKELLVNLLQERKVTEPFLALHILDLINRRNIESKENIVLWAEEISEQLRSSTEYLKAILSLKIALNNLHPSEKEKISIINRKIANYYIETARCETGFRAASFLLNAINTLSQIKDTRQERLALYEEMRDYQIESILDLQFVETEPRDITPLHKEVENILSNSKHWFDMLFRISCCITNIAKIEELKKQELKAGQNISDILFGNRVYIDHQGINMDVGNVPNTIDFGEISEQDKQNLWSKIIERMKIHHQISCVSIIKALDILNTTYTISYKDILDLCTNHPFIPQGHEEFFTKGIYYGLQGDFLTANHLLVPQIENSLRHLLQLRAEEPTTLHGNNEQERDGLNSLLDNPEIIKMLGIDGVIHIKTILLDKRYPSLRHSIAHGFINSSFFSGTGSVYMWWLVLRIIMLPFRDYWEKHYIC